MTRHTLIHEMTKLVYSDNQIFSFCDNSINFLDNMLFLCIKHYRIDVIVRLNSKNTLRQVNKGLP